MATMREEIDKYKGQVKAYPAGAPNTAVIPQDDGKFRPAEAVAMNPAPDRVSSAVGGAVRGISNVGESMSGTSGGVAMRGPEMRGNMPTTAQLQDKPFNYQQQPGMGQIARGALDVMAKTSGAISMPGAEQPFVNSIRRPIGNDVRTFDPSAVQDKSSMPGMLEGLNTARINAQQERHALVGDIGRGMLDAGGNLVSAVGKFGEDMTEGRLLGSAPSPAKAGGPVGVAQAAETPQAVTPSNAEYDTIAKEQAARQNTMGLDAIARADKEAANPTMTPDQVRATILEKNGFNRANVPVTANPGLTLSATPATPRKPLPYNGAFAKTNPQDALARKQMEVMAAERADKTLLQAPGSRDYISPMLSEAEQRTRQNEIYAQRNQDMQDVAAANTARATIAATNDMVTGKTSDRNLAMIPYAERRAIINTRNGLMENSANLEKDRKAMATAAADRTSKEGTEAMKDSTTRRGQDMEVDVQGKKLTSEERRAMLADSTTRRGQDVDADTNRTNAEIAADAKARDRAVTLEAARIKAAADAKDPVAVQMQKGRDAAIAAVLGSMTPEKVQDPVWLEWLDKTYPINGAQSGRVNPAADGNFPTR